MKQIVKFYKHFLQDLGLEVLSDDSIVVPQPEGDPIPVEIKVKIDGTPKVLPLYLPTDRQLDCEDRNVRLLFHPACESTSRGQSEVLNAVLKMASVKMHAALSATADSLICLAANTDCHGKLSQEAFELVSKVGPVSEPTVTAWHKLYTKLTGWSGSKPLLTIHINRSKSIKGTPFLRTCGVKVPLINSPDMYGVKMSFTAESAIKKTLTTVMGEEPIAHGSNSPTAPYFVAIAKTFHDFMTTVTYTSSAIGPHLRKPVDFDGKWLGGLDKLHDWYMNDMYIQLDGNIGSGGHIEEEDQEGDAAENRNKTLADKVNKDNRSRVAPMTQKPRLPVAEKEPELTEDGLPILRLAARPPQQQQAVGGWGQQQYQQQPYQQQYQQPPPCPYPVVQGLIGPQCNQYGNWFYTVQADGRVLDANAVMQELDRRAAQANHAGNGLDSWVPMSTHQPQQYQQQWRPQQQAVGGWGQPQYQAEPVGLDAYGRPIR